MTIVRHTEATIGFAAATALCAWGTDALGVGPCGGAGVIPLFIGLITGVLGACFLITLIGRVVKKYIRDSHSSDAEPLHLGL